MARKREITELLVTQLKKINGLTLEEVRYPNSPHTFVNNVDDRVFSRFKYVDEINDFPTICVYNATESRIHIGAGVKYGNYTVNLRGYIRDGDDSIAAADNLLDDIEFVIGGMRYEGCAQDIVDVRVTSVETDEGLFAPFGIAEVTLEISYEVTV